MGARAVWIAKYKDAIKVFSSEPNKRVAANYFGLSDGTEIEIIKTIPINRKQVMDVLYKLDLKEFEKIPIGDRPLYWLLRRDCLVSSLEYAGVDTVGKLAKAGRKKIRSLWMIGNVNMLEIECAMKNRDIKFKE